MPPTTDRIPCQARGCTEPRAYVVWFTSATDAQWPESLCRRDASLRSDQVRAEGGTVVRVEEITYEEMTAIRRLPDSHAFVPLSGSQDEHGGYQRCGVNGCALPPAAHQGAMSGKEE